MRMLFELKHITNDRARSDVSREKRFEVREVFMIFILFRIIRNVTHKVRVIRVVDSWSE